jgi:6-phosphogluconolactonase
MGKPELIMCRDAQELAATAARAIGRLASRAVHERGRFTLVLAGGSTPQQTYRLLAQEDSIEWTKTWLFFGDERWVLPDDDRSNYKMVRESLLDPIPIAADHVFPVPTLRPTARQCAEKYAETLARFFGTDEKVPPVFDLILLGLGDDGHTASLFPGAAALEVTNVPVTWSPSGTLPPFVDRITLTYPVLNAARQVLFLVAGANKAVAVRDVWECRVPYRERPAIGVRPTAGTLTWLLDAAAASLVETKH